MANFNLPKFHWAKILSAFFFILLLGAYANIFAIGQKYNPGETLDPACPPGEVNCTVNISGGSSPIAVVNSTNLFSTGLTGTGSGVTSATYSIFLGSYAGQQAFNALASNFLGSEAGYYATSAHDSNFFGGGAGSHAANAAASNFLGNGAGASAVNAFVSNFFGQYAGEGASNADNSNFFGGEAGFSATNASNSNFIGSGVGFGAINARNSIFIGQQAGSSDTVDNTSNGLSSILIGSFTNTGGYSNSILLGSGMSGSPISNTKANQFMLAPSITEIQLRGIDYSLPSSQGSLGQVLTNDGSGGLSWATISGDGGGSSQWSTVGSDVYYDTGNVGIGNLFAYQAKDSTSANQSLMFLASDISKTATGDMLNIGNPITGQGINFYTGGQVVGTNDRMTIAGNGFVGIGTTTPAVELHLVRKSGGFSERIDSYGSNSTLNLNRASGTLASPTIPGSGGKIGSINFGAWGGTSFTNVSSIQSSIDTGSGSGDLPTNLTFFTTPDTTATQVERMRITNAGNIGIGVASPLAGLHFVTSSNTPAIFDKYGNYSGIQFRRANGTQVSPTAIMSGNTLMALTATGYDGSNLISQNRSEISALASEDWTTSAQGTAIRFSTTTTGTKLLTERMRIDGSGNVGIGTYLPDASAILDLSSTSKGLLVPRMSGIDRDAILSPANGLLVYNTDDSSYNFYDSVSASWKVVGSGGGGGSSQWITAGSDIYYNDGNVGMGTTTPTSILDIRVGTPTQSIDQGFNENDGNGDSLNDATFSGTYNKSYSNYIYVQIDSEATPDTFSYSDDNGDCSNSNIPITGSPQFICDGISITFTSTTGHSISDQWYYGVNYSSSVTATNPVLNISDGINNYFTVNAIVPDSIFLGTNSGYSATNANNSNFLGYYAGNSAASADNSNFLGSFAGYSATNANNSNFLGNSAGQSAFSANSSNFIGQTAGYSAAYANQSNFIGSQAGYSAGYASQSNFIGSQAGYSATNAYDSNFLGISAGRSATNAIYSNFLGAIAGFSATNAFHSNFLGDFAGASATNASNSIFIGQYAGYNDTVNNTTNSLSSILLGSFTNTGGYSNSILLGSGMSGSPISNTKANQFMLVPTVTEMRLRGVDYTLPASQGGVSTVLTNNGSGVLSWASSGGGSLDVNSSFIVGGGASASYSNFIGYHAGDNASSASYSNFFGPWSGNQATNASNSTFFGLNAGQAATNASNSNFFGNAAGLSAANASYSNLFGFQSGKSFTSNYIGSNNIIIGTNISLPNATANAMNLGGVLFATGTYGTTTGNPSITAVSGGRVGIGAVSPSTILEIGSSDLGDGTAGPIITLGRNTNGTATGAGSINFLGKAGTAGYVWQDAAGNMRINTSAPTNANDTAGTVIGAQTSTRDTKIEIMPYTDYAGALAMVTSAPLNTFRYIKEVEGYGTNSPLAKTRIGFIADEVDPTFMVGNVIDQVSVNGLLIASIKEMDLRVKDLSSLDTTSATSLGTIVKNFLADIGNNITDLYASVIHSDRVETKTLCVGNTCVTEEQFLKMLNNSAPNEDRPVVDKTTTPVVSLEETTNDVPPIPEENNNDAPQSADESKTTNDETTTPSIESSSNTSTPPETPAL